MNSNNRRAWEIHNEPRRRVSKAKIMADRSTGNMSLLQQSARTLEAHLHDECTYNALGVETQVKLEEAARAILLSVRRPTEAMIRAGRTVLLPSERQLTDLEVMLVWERMIDMALSE